MRHTTARVTLLLCAFFFSLSLVPAISLAQAATPAPAPSTGAIEFCSPEEIEAGLDGVSEYPERDVLVSPASSPGMDLYMVKVTVAPGACLSYAGHILHDGAAIWLVESGAVEFDFSFIPGRPVPDLALQRADGTQGTVTPLLMLAPGDWVSADRAVNYSYRNKGTAPAVIIMTVLENRWVYDGDELPPGERCLSGCANSRRR